MPPTTCRSTISASYDHPSHDTRRDKGEPDEDQKITHRDHLTPWQWDHATQEPEQWALSDGPTTAQADVIEVSSVDQASADECRSIDGHSPVEDGHEEVQTQTGRDEDHAARTDVHDSECEQRAGPDDRHQ